MPAQIILVRHGERVDHIDPSWRLTAEHPSDSPLSPVGHQQAAAAAAHLTSPSALRITSIYSSPFTRTLETAAPLSRAADVPVHRETGVAEWLCADWWGEGFHWPEVGDGAGLLWKGGGRLLEGYVARVDAVFPETREGVAVRVAEGVRAILRREEEREAMGEVEKGGAVVIVAHGKVVEDALVALVGGDGKDVPYVTYCSISVVVQEGSGETRRWVCGDAVRTDFMAEDIRPEAKRRVYA